MKGTQCSELMRNSSGKNDVVFKAWESCNFWYTLITQRMHQLDTERLCCIGNNRLNNHICESELQLDHIILFRFDPASQCCVQHIHAAQVFSDVDTLAIVDEHSILITHIVT